MSSKGCTNLIINIILTKIVMENENINFGKKKEKVHLTDWSYNYPVWAVFSPKTIIACNGIVFAEASSLAVYR